MNKLLIIALLTITNCGLAQKKKTVYDTKFELSDELTGQKGLGFMTLGSDGSNLYSMSTKGAIVNGIPMGFKYVLNKYDSKMNHVLSEKVPMKTDAYKIGYYTGITIGMYSNRIIQTVSGYNKKTSKESFYVVEYSTSSLKPRGRLFLDSYKAKKKGKSKSKNFATTIHDPKNTDEFAVIVQSSKTSTKSSASLFIIDKSLKITQKSEFGIEGSYDQTRFTNYIITEDFVSFVCIIKGKKDAPDRANFYLIDRETENVNSFEILLKDIGNDISDFECAIHEDGRLYVSGFYKADGEKVNDSGGAFTQIYTLNDGAIASQDIRPFTFEFITEKMSEKQKKKTAKRSSKGKDIDVFSYLVRHVIPNADGSSTLVAERYRYYQTSTTDSKGRTTYVDHYIHSDLIIMRTSKDGTIEWIERFKKYNHSTSPLLGPFIFKDGETDFHIVYYEDEAIKIAQISKEDGTGKAKEVFTKKDIGRYPVAIGSAIQVSENQYLAQFSRLKKSRTFTIEFEAK